MWRKAPVQKLWKTFMDLAITEERGQIKVYAAVFQAYKHFEMEWCAIRRVGHTFASDLTTTSLLKIASFSSYPTCPLSTSYSQSGTVACVVQVDIHWCFLLILAPSHPHSLFTLFSCLFYTSHLILRFYSLFTVWNSPANAVDVRPRVCARFVVV